MKSAKAEENSYHIESVDFAVRVLSVVAAEPDLTMAEIARRLGGSRQRMMRMLRTLEASNMIQRGGDRKSYRLGIRALLISKGAQQQFDIVRLAEPMLERLGEAVQETVQLRLREGPDTVCVARWEPQRPVRVNAVIGVKRPLHVGSGKIFLAYMPEAEREAYLAGALERFTENTLTDAAQLRQRLPEIRAAGFVVSQGELSRDMIAVAAPVLAADGAIAACLTVGAPAGRIGPQDVALMRDKVVAAAAELSRQLGHAPG